MTTTQGLDQYLPVAVQTLIGAENLDFDLYVANKSGRPLLFRSRNAALGSELERTVDWGLKTMLIRFADRAAYEHHLQTRLTADDGLSAAGKYALLTAATRQVFENALQGGSVAGMVRAADEFGTQLADALCGRSPVLRELFDLMLHDYSTYTHSANVATYCVCLAQTLGITDRNQVAQIATGALLHDLGKREIEPYVLNKTQGLSKQERSAIQRHPHIGFIALSRDPKLSWSQLMMVYQHHERLDGRGYPVGVVEDEIDPWAKICAVADVFDALTSDRPYRKAMTTREAYAFLEQRGKSFDHEVVRCLKTAMQKT